MATDACTSHGHPWVGAELLTCPWPFILSLVLLFILSAVSSSPFSSPCFYSVVQPITGIIFTYSKKCDKTVHADLSAKTVGQN